MSEAKTLRLKRKERENILEFLFQDNDSRISELENYMGKYLENKEKCLLISNLYENIKKETEQQAKFTASFSHEIKNPLNGIIAYSELLKRNSALLPLDLKRYVENICISSNQLKNLTTGAINSVKEVQKQPFDADLAINDVLKNFEPQIKEKGLTLSLITLKTEITSDITKFKQILYNLIGNAVKFADENSPIEITSWVSKGFLWCEIQNYGADKNAESSGIGLVVCRELMKLLDGKISFEMCGNKAVSKFCVPV